MSMECRPWVPRRQPSHATSRGRVCGGRSTKAASLQPYLSAINGFYRNHVAEPVAQGDLISKFFAVSAGFQQPGDATAAYAIGVVLKKIKHFGGWAQLSSVVLDYVNPTALPCAASWQLFGWLTPWGGPPATNKRLPAHGRHDGNCGTTMVKWSYW
eukprot:jgi/Tetstr1/431347/TSEL_021038.t1